MRLFVLVAALLALLATPAHAGEARVPKTMLGRFVQKRVTGWKAGVQKLKATWKNPVTRKKFLGRVAVNTLIIGAGEVVDSYLRHKGMPPVAAAFAAGAAPAYASHFMQKALHIANKNYFDAPKKQTQGALLRDAAFAGTIGVGAKVGLDKIGQVFDSSSIGQTLGDNSNKAAALGRAGARGMVLFGKRIMKGLRFSGRKVSEHLVGEAAERGRQEGSSLFKKNKRQPLVPATQD